MTLYTTVAEAINSGMKRIIHNLPAADKAKVVYNPADDISAGLNSLADIILVALVADNTETATVQGKYASMSNTAANAAAKLVEAVEALSRKANPNAVASFTVTFYDGDGETVLQTSTVEIGDTASYTGETPVDPEGGTFSGWSPALGPINDDVSYHPVFTYEDDEGGEG